MGALDAAWLFLKASPELGAVRLVHRDHLDKIMAEGMHPQDQPPEHLKFEQVHHEPKEFAHMKPIDMSKPGTWHTLPYKPWLHTAKNIMANLYIDEDGNLPLEVIGITGSMHDFEHQSRNANESRERLPEMYVTEHISPDRLVHMGSFQEALDSVPEARDVGQPPPAGHMAAARWGPVKNSRFVGETYDWPEAPEEQ